MNGKDSYEIKMEKSSYDGDTYDDADPFETVHELVISFVTTAEDGLIRAVDSTSL